MLAPPGGAAGAAAGKALLGAGAVVGTDEAPNVKPAPDPGTGLVEVGGAAPGADPNENDGGGGEEELDPPKENFGAPVSAVAAAGAFVAPKENAGPGSLGPATGAGTGKEVEDPPNVNLGVASPFADRFFLFPSEGPSSCLEGIDPNAMLAAGLASTTEDLDPN